MTTFEAQLNLRLVQHFIVDDDLAIVKKLQTFIETLPSSQIYPIHINDAVSLLGISTKGNAKQTIESYFIVGDDYIAVDALQNIEAKRGRPPKDLILTLDTFRSLCMLCKTRNGQLARQYFNIHYELCQIMLREEQATTVLKRAETRESAILEHFPPNVQCVYYGTIDNISSDGESLVKFGNSNDLRQRVTSHRRTYKNFRLVSAFRVCNKLMIENVIKKDLQLKQYRRAVKADDGTYLTELLATSNASGEITFNSAQLDEWFRAIVDQHEYNVDNYAKVLAENDKLVCENTRLKEEVRLWNEHKRKRDEDSAITSVGARKGVSSTNITPVAGLVLYAYRCEQDKDRFTCDICRPTNMEERTLLLNAMYPNGEMAHTHKVASDLSFHVMNWLVRSRLTNLSKKVFDGDLDDIKLIFAIVAQFETLVVGKTCLATSLEALTNLGQPMEVDNDPEVPLVRKGRRPVCQVHPETGSVIATYPTIEAAGRAIGTSGSAIGIALRTRSLSSGYRWQYANFSPDEQFKDQPVVKVNCCTGERTAFPNLGSAAKDAKISTPGLRNRILTDVHFQKFHWIFDRGVTHWTSDV